MTLTTPSDWVYFILLSGLMGITGQFVRSLGGAKKVNDQAATLGVSFSTVFETSVFFTSLATGFAAGTVAALATMPKAIDVPYLLGILAAGYAGADFVEAFLKKSLPDLQKAAENLTPKSAEMLEARGLLATRTMTALPAAAANIAEAVRVVVAAYKHIDRSEVVDSKTFDDLKFTEGDCLDLEQKLNLYFYNDLGMAFDRLLEGPDDITPKHTIRQLIAKVKSLHPRQRS
jgi:hypothetical protein